VPSLFLAIAMLEFFLMLLDRMVYTAKALGSKLVLQWVTVLGFHIWIFFVLPSSKQYARPLPHCQLCATLMLRSRRVAFRDNGILPVWYLAKCFYWYFSARQVRPRPRRLADGGMAAASALTRPCVSAADPRWVPAIQH
jgi:piezo-type mechanosensitive ion channel component 1/2